ncbi:MAG: hypothetical protein ACI9LD_000357 [Polaromonas sp.]|jgi:hypothetical protein
MQEFNLMTNRMMTVGAWVFIVLRKTAIALWRAA